MNKRIDELLTLLSVSFIGAKIAEKLLERPKVLVFGVNPPGDDIEDDESEK